MSSWNEITIGEGDKGNTAITMRNLQSNHLHISSNKFSFWISGAFLNTDMIIFKNTLEGKYLIEAVHSESDEVIIEWIDTLVLKNLDTKILKNKIEDACSKAFAKGSEDRARTIRSALLIK